MKQPEDIKTPDMFDAAVKQLIEEIDSQDEIARLVTLHAKYINSFYPVSAWRTDSDWYSRHQPTKRFTSAEKNELIRIHLVRTTNKIKGQFK